MVYYTAEKSTVIILAECAILLKLSIDSCLRPALKVKKLTSEINRGKINVTNKNIL